MDESKNLIIIKKDDGTIQDKTNSIESISVSSNERFFNIKFFSNEQEYNYQRRRIIYLTGPTEISIENIKVAVNGKIQDTIVKILKFEDDEMGNSFFSIFYKNGRKKNIESSKVDIARSCLSDKKVYDAFEYLKKVSEITSMVLNSKKILFEQYNKIDFIEESLIAAVYLNPEKYRLKKYSNVFLIFPFGCNKSQFAAVKSAMENSLSVIQGPPGTGKTQTILNIIANLLIQNKTLQVVSNNNSAVSNILEKLTIKKLDFICAFLGKNENKDDFISKQTDQYPEELTKWKKSKTEQLEIKNQIKQIYNNIQTIFDFTEKRAVKTQEKKDLELEKKYFDEFAKSNFNVTAEIKIRKNISTKEIVRIWNVLQEKLDKGKNISLWNKIDLRFFKGIATWEFYKNPLQSIIVLLQFSFYSRRKKDINKELSEIDSQLKNLDADRVFEKLRNNSMSLLKAKIYERYSDSSARHIFTSDDLYFNPSDFQKEYPIVLSTTFSSNKSLSPKAEFDYVIMDEASQVDIATGTLALCNAKNAVIVGDKKQLPNVLEKNKRVLLESIFNECSVSKNYDASRKSFLQSVCDVLPDAPQTLLREHYRCHPKIISFCNKKFYNNELIIMTKDNGEHNVLNLFYTAEGNHAREFCNQRQVDCIQNEILPTIKTEDIGIIAPYNEQVNLIEKSVDSEIKVATVHKFQGKENDSIIFSSTENVVSDFVDDSNILNVAISRAKKQFYLVISKNEQPKNSNIADLISYIQYSNGTITISKIYSVFDYLYSQFRYRRKDFLKGKRRISEYASENLFFNLIGETIKELDYEDLSVICHEPLNFIIKDFSAIRNPYELDYAKNPSTHVDFLILNTASKKPFLAIEVDGWQHHNKKTLQAERDKLKDEILATVEIPLQRFSTTGSNEKDKLIAKLQELHK